MFCTSSELLLNLGKNLLYILFVIPLPGGTLLSNYLCPSSVPWRSVHPQTNHVTFRPKLSVHPTNRLLWQFTIVTIVHLYDPSTYFSSTPPSRWTVFHLWHNVHPPHNALWHHLHPFLKQNLDGLSQHFRTHLWHPAGCLATCGRFVTGLFPNMFAMSSRLFSEVWMFWRLIFGHLWCPAHLLSKLWTFCHRILEKSKKSHETVPLRIRCNTWKWAETGEFSGNMDLLSRLDEMSQQSWTKNTPYFWTSVMSRPPAQQTLAILSQDLQKKQEISWDSPFKDPL
jgi:hypothetical protein